MLSRARTATGIALLITGIAVYMYIAYVVPVSILDDKVGWMHKHLISFYKTSSDTIDYRLWYTIGKDLSRSPALVDKLLAGVIDPGSIGVVSIASLIILSILVYIASYLVFREHIAAGLAALLVLTTPVSIYWFRVNMYGSYIALPLGYLAILVYSLSIKKNSLAGAIVSAILVSITWALWGCGWFTLLLVASYTIVIIYYGVYSREAVLSNILALLVTLLLNISGISRYYTVYHLFAQYLVLTSSISIVLARRTFEKKPVVSNIWRIIGSITPVALSVTLTALTSNYIELPGLLETYYKSYRPLADYLAVAIFSPFALVVFVRAGYASSPSEKPLEYMLIAGFILSMLLAQIDPTLAVYTVASIAPIIAYGLERLYWATKATLLGKTRYVFIAIVLWVIASSIAANAYSGYTVASSKPAVYYGPVSRELVAVPLENSTLLNILDYIPRDSIVIAYWGNSYWILGYRSDLYTLADDDGPIEGYRLVSRIFMSDEYTALGILNKTIGLENKSIYIVVSEVISVEKHPVLGTKSAYIGRPIVFRRLGQESIVRFMPLDDVARIPLYIDTAGYDMEKYLDYSKATYVFETPLAWTDRMKDTILFKLLVIAVNELGYSLMNDLYSRFEIKLGEDELPRHIVFVNASVSYMYTVSTERTSYDVYWMVTLFRVETISPTTSSSQ